MENSSKNNMKILDVVDLSKEFPGVKALSGLNFDLFKGEVHCLIGENGAGKSTFIKILSGAFPPNGGYIVFENEKHRYFTPHLSRALGIQTVYQEDVLVPYISAAENIFLGVEENSSRFFLSYSRMFKNAKELSDRYGINVTLNEIFANLSPPDQQYVKILKALAQEPKVLILDEPTQAFNVDDANRVIQISRRVAGEGVGVIFIAHNLDEVMEAGDRITVLRDGKKIITHHKDENSLNPDLLATEMVGRDVELFYKKKETEIGDYIFEVKGLKLENDSEEINFKLRKGEILGIAGLKGSGRTEMARAIFGASPKAAGKILYKGKEVDINSPNEGIRAKIAYLAENKEVDGLFMGLPVDQNITVVGLDKLGKIFLNLKKERWTTRDFVNKLNIRTPSLSQEVNYLSGGNQQKVAIAKWLFGDSDILIVDEPTHGIDVNAKVEVYELFTGLVAQGKSIIMISSEMPELISISDRILVLKDFKITKELAGEEMTEENILKGFIGGDNNGK